VRLLFVASRFPYPPWRGDQARAYHQIRGLASRHQITLLTPGTGEHAAEGVATLQGMGVELRVIPGGTFGRATSAARGWLAGLPAQAGWTATPRLRRALAELLAQRRHDLLHVQLARAGAGLPARPGLPVLVDLIDALSANMARRAARESRLFWRLAARLEQPRLARLERALCARVALATVVSDDDRRMLADSVNVAVNANGVDVSTFQPVAAPRLPERLVFGGNLGYFPNIDALEWLVREILPRVWQHRPGVQLDMVGARPAPALRRLVQGDARLRLIGEVPVLAPYLARARVALAPLRAGSGQLFKVLEALACATPVVATSRALAGLDEAVRAGTRVAEQPADLAAAIVHLLEHEALATRLGTTGRAAVIARHSWERVVAELEQLYEGLLARPQVSSNSA
jgi:glycosyltransferase involved in cell wall biosynthesis